MGPVVWVGFSSGRLGLWQAESGELIGQLAGHEGSIECMAAVSNTVWTGSGDYSIGVWDVEKRVLNTTLTGHSNWVRCLLYAHGHVWSGSDDCTLRVWDPTTGRCMAELGGHTGGVLSMAAVGDEVWSGSCDKTIRVWGTATRRHKKELTGHDGWVTCLALSGGYVWSGSTDRTVKVWAPSSQLLRTLSGHSGWVWCLLAIPALGTVWSGSSDKMIRIWRGGRSSPQRSRPPHAAGGGPGDRGTGYRPPPLPLLPLPVDDVRPERPEATTRPRLRSPSPPGEPANPGATFYAVEPPDQRARSPSWTDAVHGNHGADAFARLQPRYPSRDDHATARPHAQPHFPPLDMGAGGNLIARDGSPVSRVLRGRGAGSVPDDGRRNSFEPRDVEAPPLVPARTRRKAQTWTVPFHGDPTEEPPDPGPEDPAPPPAAPPERAEVAESLRSNLDGHRAKEALMWETASEALAHYMTTANTAYLVPPTLPGDPAAWSDEAAQGEYSAANMAALVARRDEEWQARIGGELRRMQEQYETQLRATRVMAETEAEERRHLQQELAELSATRHAPATPAPPTTPAIADTPATRVPPEDQDPDTTRDAHATMPLRPAPAPAPPAAEDALAAALEKELRAVRALVQEELRALKETQPAPAPAPPPPTPTPPPPPPPPPKAAPTPVPHDAPLAAEERNAAERRRAEERVATDEAAAAEFRARLTEQLAALTEDGTLETQVTTLLRANEAFQKALQARVAESSVASPAALAALGRMEAADAAFRRACLERLATRVTSPEFEVARARLLAANAAFQERLRVQLAALLAAPDAPAELRRRLEEIRDSNTAFQQRLQRQLDAARGPGAADQVELLEGAVADFQRRLAAEFRRLKDEGLAPPDKAEEDWRTSVRALRTASNEFQEHVRGELDTLRSVAESSLKAGTASVGSEGEAIAASCARFHAALEAQIAALKAPPFEGAALHTALSEMDDLRGGSTAFCERVRGEVRAAVTAAQQRALQLQHEQQMLAQRQQHEQQMRQEQARIAEAALAAATPLKKPSPLVVDTPKVPTPRGSVPSPARSPMPAPAPSPSAELATVTAALETERTAAERRAVATEQQQQRILEQLSALRDSNTDFQNRLLRRVDDLRPAAGAGGDERVKAARRDAEGAREAAVAAARQQVLDRQNAGDRQRKTELEASSLRSQRAVAAVGNPFVSPARATSPDAREALEATSPMRSTPFVPPGSPMHPDALSLPTAQRPPQQPLPAAAAASSADTGRSDAWPLAGVTGRLRAIQEELEESRRRLRQRGPPKAHQPGTRARTPPERPPEREIPARAPASAGATEAEGAGFGEALERFKRALDAERAAAAATRGRSQDASLQNTVHVATNDPASGILLAPAVSPWGIKHYHFHAASPTPATPSPEDDYSVTLSPTSEGDMRVTVARAEMGLIQHGTALRRLVDEFLEDLHFRKASGPDVRDVGRHLRQTFAPTAVK